MRILLDDIFPIKAGTHPISCILCKHRSSAQGIDADTFFNGYFRRLSNVLRKFFLLLRWLIVLQKLFQFLFMLMAFGNKSLHLGQFLVHFCKLVF